MQEFKNYTHLQLALPDSLLLSYFLRPSQRVHRFLRDLKQRVQLFDSNKQLVTVFMQPNNHPSDSSARVTADVERMLRATELVLHHHFAVHYASSTHSIADRVRIGLITSEPRVVEAFQHKYGPMIFTVLDKKSSSPSTSTTTTMSSSTTSESELIQLMSAWLVLNESEVSIVSAHSSFAQTAVATQRVSAAHGDAHPQKHVYVVDAAECVPATQSASSSSSSPSSTLASSSSGAAEGDDHDAVPVCHHDEKLEHLFETAGYAFRAPPPPLIIFDPNQQFRPGNVPAAASRDL